MRAYFTSNFCKIWHKIHKILQKRTISIGLRKPIISFFYTYIFLSLKSGSTTYIYMHFLFTTRIRATIKKTLITIQVLWVFMKVVQLKNKIKLVHLKIPTFTKNTYNFFHSFIPVGNIKISILICIKIFRQVLPPFILMGLTFVIICAINITHFTKYHTNRGYNNPEYTKTK